jgi:hypothetical protein
MNAGFLIGPVYVYNLYDVCMFHLIFTGDLFIFETNAAININN